jgi:hypothetical protein
MSDTILSGDVTVYYLDENRQKRLEWSGGATTITANALYSALQDHFDELGQMDDGVPMSAQTPTEYTVGSIDSGDLDPWYMSYELMEHVTGGAVKTAGWTHSDGSAVGIICVKVDTGGAIVAGDVGFDISGASTGNGTLLEVIIDPNGDSTFDYLMIRPDTNGASDQFTTDTQNITCNAHVSVQDTAVSHTGEQIWANLYSIGTIEADTHIYVYQGAAATDGDRKRIYSVTSPTAPREDWWGDGHIDMCLYLKDFQTVGYDTIDAGYATVLARKGNSEYSSFEVANSVTSGGRNPCPLSTKPDLNNTTGYQSITFTAGTGSWNVGDEISGDTSGARAVITQIDNPGSTQTLHYYLIDDPLTTFQTAAEGITNEDTLDTGTKDGNVPANQGPALTTWFTSNTLPTTAFTTATTDTLDFDDDGTDEYWGITIDCNANPLTEVYEWLKYITRRGATGTTDTDGIPGELYEGATVYLEYSGSPSGTINEGSDVTQETSGATGVIISHDATNKVMLLRNTRGTFATHATTHTLTSNDDSQTVEIDVAAVTFAPNVVAPFGSFAGGTFFGARGVRIIDWLAADENSFQLTPIDGGTKSRPQAISITITNLVGTDENTTTDDRVAVFRLTGSGGVIDKTEMGLDDSAKTIGDTTLVVDAAIAQDVPGKSTGGVLRIRDNSDNNKGYRLRYSSWTGSTFTLANISTTEAETGTNTTTIVSSGAFATAKRGDLVINHTRSEAVSYVTRVTTDDDSVIIFPAIAGQTSADDIDLNGVPIATSSGDDLYVCLIDKYADASTASVSIIWTSNLYFRVRCRNNAATTKILPFNSDDSSLSNTDNKSIPVIRQEDTITA